MLERTAAKSGASAAEYKDFIPSKGRALQAQDMENLLLNKAERGGKNPGSLDYVIHNHIGTTNRNNQEEQLNQYYDILREDIKE